MTYTVIWKESAIREATAVEAATDDPAVVRTAAARIDWAPTPNAPRHGRVTNAGLPHLV